MNKTERISAKLGNASGVTSVQTGSLARSQMAIAVQAEKGKYVPRTFTSRPGDPEMINLPNYNDCRSGNHAQTREPHV